MSALAEAAVARAARMSGPGHGAVGPVGQDRGRVKVATSSFSSAAAAETSPAV